MGSWTVTDARDVKTTDPDIAVSSNALAVWFVANGHNPKIYATNDSTHEKLDYGSGVFGDPNRQWDLYDETGRIKTYINNDQAFMVLAKNAMDDDVRNDSFYFVNINNLSERLRWDTEKDWFEIFTV